MSRTLSPVANPARAGVVNTEAELNELLTRPGPALVEAIRTYSGPLVILGAGGKMGPSLALLAKRAAEAAGHSLEVLAVSRFTDARAQKELESGGVKTLSLDLLEAKSVAQLPETQNVIYLVGLKFGTSQNPGATWAMNTIVPARVLEFYSKARIVALSTANVYPLTPWRLGGAVESTPLTPLGEYANAAIGRERIFEFYSRGQGTPVALMRLHYAVELRYGVLVDVARKVHAGSPIDLANGYLSWIWQGDANEMILRALPLCSTPPSAWNLCRPEVFSVREVAERFGRRFGKAVAFTREEAPTALVTNPAKLCSALGAPSVELDQAIDWIAHWIQQGGRDLRRPTHFEVRDGVY